MTLKVILDEYIRLKPHRPWFKFFGSLFEGTGSTVTMPDLDMETIADCRDVCGDLGIKAEALYDETQKSVTYVMKIPTEADRIEVGKLMDKKLEVN